MPKIISCCHDSSPIHLVMWVISSRLTSLFVVLEFMHHACIGAIHAVFLPNQLGETYK